MIVATYSQSRTRLRGEIPSSAASRAAGGFAWNGFTRRAGWRIFIAAVLIGAGLATGGCFTRRIVIDTEPVSADVIVNQRNMGRSPVAIETADFGDLDLRIEAPGYQPVWKRLPQPRPWYGYDPILFLLEVTPYPFRADQIHRVTLTPQPPIDPQALNARAQAAAGPQEPAPETR